MENIIKSMLVGVAVGIVIGGVVVSKNKKLATKVDQMSDQAGEKLMELKDQAQQKMEKIKSNSKKSKSVNKTKTAQN